MQGGEGFGGHNIKEFHSLGVDEQKNNNIRMALNVWYQKFLLVASCTACSRSKNFAKQALMTTRLCMILYMTQATRQCNHRVDCPRQTEDQEAVFAVLCLRGSIYKGKVKTKKNSKQGYCGIYKIAVGCCQMLLTHMLVGSGLTYSFV